MESDGCHKTRQPKGVCWMKRNRPNRVWGSKGSSLRSGCALVFPSMEWIVAGVDWEGGDKVVAMSENHETLGDDRGL